MKIPYLSHPLDSLAHKKKIDYSSKKQKIISKTKALNPNVRSISHN
jgi:hypothetical protein